MFSFVENCDKINPLSVKKIIDFWIIEYLLDIAVVLDRNSNIAAFCFVLKCIDFKQVDQVYENIWIFVISLT